MKFVCRDRRFILNGNYCIVLAYYKNLAKHVDLTDKQGLSHTEQKLKSSRSCPPADRCSGTPAAH
ncbi:hypothetical protein OUZ56_000887 [Daphnia magna]|uniref:Uncharacterized protein n=1 Tax=Daphnia magna TaxID=35525 RepID=A0ABR0A116_9CRUS|nr:hypothetical protein OUZ56_000887 [Daphnia magna]